jgi:hypothetical protein
MEQRSELFLRGDDWHVTVVGEGFRPDWAGAHLGTTFGPESTEILRIAVDFCRPPYYDAGPVPPPDLRPEAPKYCVWLCQAHYTHREVLYSTDRIPPYRSCGCQLAVPVCICHGTELADYVRDLLDHAGRAGGLGYFGVLRDTEADTG